MLILLVTKVHLYAGKTLLAVARIPLSSLATVTTIADEYPLMAEGINVSMDTCPLVAVMVSITTEIACADKLLPLATILNTDVDDDASSKSGHSDSSHSNSIKSPRRNLSEQFDAMETANQPSSKCSSPISPLSINQVSPSNDHMPSTDHIPPVSSSNTFQDTKEQLITPLADQNQTSISTNQLNPTNRHEVPSAINVLTNQIQTAISTNQNEDAHHFCVAIDVRSLRLLVDYMSNAQLTGRYSYPFFGTTQSVILPAIKPQPYMECAFDQSYCAFDFATPRGVLMTQLNSVPLVIELLENNSSVVAMATVMMSVLLTQPIQSLIGGVHRQYYDSKVAVVSRSVITLLNRFDPTVALF